MSIVTRLISDADREARYLSAGELSTIQGFYEAGQNRIRIAGTIAANDQRIVEQGTLRFWQRCPVTPSNDGDPRHRASCMRDQTWYVRLVASSIIAGDVGPLEEVGLRGAKEMYKQLGVPQRNIAECMRCLKEVAMDLLSFEDAAEAGPYFDYLIQGMMP